VIVIDYGPEFISQGVDQQAYQNGVQLHFITPGRRVENGYIESFNGKFRDECLNENWFFGLADARRKIAEWKRDYNHVRPHSALGYLTLMEFAAARPCRMKRKHPLQRRPCSCTVFATPVPRNGNPGRYEIVSLGTVGFTNRATAR
jgi:transposase InsO family protein